MIFSKPTIQWLYTLILCFAFYAPMNAHAAKTFNAEHYTLDNGLEVVVIPNDRVPVITHMVWYRVGAADEPEGVSGIAHFMEHLMFKGSKGLKPGEFSEIIRGLGGNDNAFTSQDYTAYFQSIAAEHLETVMRMEAGRMRSMNPPPAQFKSEHKVILEERSQRIDNNPASLLGEKMNEALYPDHPYGDPVIGWRDEMESLTWDDAKTFYDQWYAPNNAILVVSGDVTGEQVLTLAKEIYGPLETANIPLRKRYKEPQDGLPLSIKYEDASVRQPTVQRTWIVPSYRQNPMDSLAFQVMADIIGQGSSARLYQSLVVEQKIASAAGLSYQSDAWDNGTISAYAVPLPDVTLDVLEAAIVAEIKKLADENVTQTEVDEAISRLQNEAIYARDSVSGPAMIFGHALATGSKIDDVEYWSDNLESVTAAHIQNVVQNYLLPDAPEFKNAVTGYLLPAAAAPITGTPADLETQDGAL